MYQVEKLYQFNLGGIMAKKIVKTLEKAPKNEKPEPLITFTLTQYELWKKAGTNTGIVLDFPVWLERQK